MCIRDRITGDTIQVNRKFKAPISFKFKGFMVQCLNEMPRVKDKSDSFYRRQLFIPFTKCFTGAERKYIKDCLLYTSTRTTHPFYLSLWNELLVGLGLNLSVKNPRCV